MGAGEVIEGDDLEIVYDAMLPSLHTGPGLSFSSKPHNKCVRSLAASMAIRFLCCLLPSVNLSCCNDALMDSREAHGEYTFAMGSLL